MLNMQGENHVLQHELQQAHALQQSASSHCTLAIRMIETANTCLDNANKKHNQGTGKNTARIIIAPDLEEHFDEEECMAEAQEKDEKDKEKAKATEATEHDCRIVKATSS
jgi:hypothetical protein